MINNNIKFHSIAIFGDEIGIPSLTPHIPIDKIACLIVASNRQHSIDKVKHYSDTIKKPLLIQPAKNTSKFNDFLKNIQSMNVDLILCHSYSMRLPSSLLALVNNNAINIHYSHLPYNRGPNPVQWSLIKDEHFTGVTIHYMDYEFDSGDIIYQRKVNIDDQDTWLSLFAKLDRARDELLANHMLSILQNNHPKIPQDESLATHNKRLTPDTPLIDFETMTDRQIFNLIRAQIAPLSGAYIFHNGRRIDFPEYIPYAKITNLREQYSSKTT